MIKQINSMKTKTFLLLGLAFVLSMNGCDNSKIPFGYVTGKLTIDGKPAPKNMSINFYPEIQGGSPSIGYTKDDGSFEMNFSLSRKGVEAGPNKVVIENPDGGRPAVPAGVLKANNKLLWEKPVEVKKGRQKINLNIDTSLKAEEEPAPRGGRGRRQPQQNEGITDINNPSDG
ncbi:MAG: hypothetical protein LBJ67_00795 [Planctomycetaceae bacterium]|jgi:hypothetical protein|nr:hypothetical protein [Planctomycetaceae bacterium]